MITAVVIIHRSFSVLEKRYFIVFVSYEIYRTSDKNLKKLLLYCNYYKRNFLNKTQQDTTYMMHFVKHKKHA